MNFSKKMFFCLMPLKKFQCSSQLLFTCCNSLSAFIWDWRSSSVIDWLMPGIYLAKRAGLRVEYWQFKLWRLLTIFWTVAVVMTKALALWRLLMIFLTVACIMTKASALLTIFWTVAGVMTKALALSRQPKYVQIIINKERVNYKEENNKIFT